MVDGRFHSGAHLHLLLLLLMTPRRCGRVLAVEHQTSSAVRTNEATTLSPDKPLT